MAPATPDKGATPGEGSQVFAIGKQSYLQSDQYDLTLSCNSGFTKLCSQMILLLALRTRLRQISLPFPQHLARQGLCTAVTLKECRV